MIRFRKYSDINFFSYFSITNYVAFACFILSLILPIYNNHNANSALSLIDVLQLSFTTINILTMVLILAVCLIFLFNLFFQPSWFTYFLNVALVIYTFISPVLINFQLFPLLNLHQSSLTLSIGSILIMISAMLFMGIEIYKVSVMDVFVNANLKDKQEKELKKFINARRFRFEKKQEVTVDENDNTVETKKTRKYYRIKRAKIKTDKKYKVAQLPKIQEYIHHLEKVYKI